MHKDTKPPVSEYTLQRKYIDQIRDGSKTSEGRINSGGFKALKIEDQIRFFDRREPEYDVLCQITGIGRYPSFRKMLEAEGFETMIPDAPSLEDAVAVYNSIPSFPERARKHGVVALRLAVLEDE